MGATALLRQTHLDAAWYEEASAKGQAGVTNLSLEAFVEAQSLPRVFQAGHWKDALRADAVLDEFGVTQPIVVGNGHGYQRAVALKEADVRMVIPAKYPGAYDVSDPYLARLVGLDELKHWELALKTPPCFTLRACPSPSVVGASKTPLACFLASDARWKKACPSRRLGRVDPRPLPRGLAWTRSSAA